MTPIKFTVKDNTTHFHYKSSELVDFVRRGKKDGNVGLILTKREGNWLTYRGFGTIDSPFNYIATITIENYSLLDGKMLADEERLIAPKPLFADEDKSIVILDFSKLNTYN